MDDGETIQFGDTANKAQKAACYSFEQLYELVRAVDEWRAGRTQKSYLVKAPIIEDARQDPITTQAILNQTQASSIQQQVEASMQKAGDDTPVASFVNQGEIPTDKIPPAPENIDLTDTVEGSENLDISADSLGMSIESLNRLGPVPETPPEFKNQLNEIKKDRSKKPAVASGKSIKRN